MRQTIDLSLVSRSHLTTFIKFLASKQQKSETQSEDPYILEALKSWIKEILIGLSHGPIHATIQIVQSLAEDPLVTGLMIAEIEKFSPSTPTAFGITLLQILKPSMTDISEPILKSLKYAEQFSTCAALIFLKRHPELRLQLNIMPIIKDQLHHSMLFPRVTSPLSHNIAIKLLETFEEHQFPLEVVMFLLQVAFHAVRGTPSLPVVVTEYVCFVEGKFLEVLLPFLPQLLVIYPFLSFHFLLKCGSAELHECKSQIQTAVETAQSLLLGYPQAAIMRAGRLLVFRHKLLIPAAKYFHYFPKVVQSRILLLFMMAATRDGIPVHPECHLWKLSKDLLNEIAAYLIVAEKENWLQCLASESTIVQQILKRGWKTHSPEMDTDLLHTSYAAGLVLLASLHNLE